MRRLQAGPVLLAGLPEGGVEAAQGGVQSRGRPFGCRAVDRGRTCSVSAAEFALVPVVQGWRDPGSLRQITLLKSARLLLMRKFENLCKYC